MAAGELSVLVAVSRDIAESTRLSLELARAGFAVVEADSIPEAHRHIHRRARLDGLVVSISGDPSHSWDLVERVRKEVGLARLPIVILGETFADADSSRAEQLDCSYLAFPVEANEIVARVHRVIRRAKRTLLRPVRVLLLTDVCEIEGTLHVSPELARFSDAWQEVMADERPFVPITRARVSTLEGQRIIATPDLIEVPKAHLRAIFPTDQSGGNGSAASTSPAAVARLEKLTLRLAKELARERNVPVETMLADVAGSLDQMPEEHEPPRQA